MHGSDDRTAVVIDDSTRPIPRLRPYHLLALLPTVGLLGGVTFANRVEPYVLGLPFLLFWVVAWVVLTSGIMALVATLDDGQPAETDTGHAAPSTSGSTSRSTERSTTA